jgi:translation initiation factor 1 (eIF-1/SUI1)
MQSEWQCPYHIHHARHSDHGEWVCIATGMEAFSIDPDELAGALQRRFQSSASVTKLPGKTETGVTAASAVWFGRSCQAL